MNDVEFVAVWDFLNESDMDEIVGGATDAASFLQSAFEASVAALKVDDASPSEASDVSSSDNDTQSKRASSAPTRLAQAAKKTADMPTDQRKRQKAYDRKYRQKKDEWRGEAAKSLVAGLKLLNVLLEDRIQRTRRVSGTMRLLHLGKEDRKFPDYDYDLQVANREAKTQLGLNQAAATYIELWTATWTLSKMEKGKFFLKPYVPKIDKCLEELVRLGEKLAGSTTELEWCLDQKPTGVWL
ncbi:hypothetical protein PHYPSEUDO_011480 [Phytophthora pseudosyringae]|uniref:Uncharacterized protein n=1 Tax=Phytophthora pseudosyringae TaxID=221518 RepID=A0A8T1VB98_9STRA|nr:hypothetical protein PHYPSEUDO_011480 [Phytophthora pseudosyringae]